MAELPARTRWEDVAMNGATRIREVGIARVSLDDIAADLRVAPEAVRYWFSDEVELLISIMQIRQRWFLDEADTRLAALPSQTARLRALIDLIVADHDATYWVELWKLGLRDARARDERQKLITGYRDLFARLIRAGQRKGEFADVSPDQVALIMVALSVGLSIEVTMVGGSEPDRMNAMLTTSAERLLEVELPPSEQS